MSKKRKPFVSSKYYFFDVGVVASLQGREFRPGTTEFGEAFETLLMHERICYRAYEQGDSLSFWRSASGHEVDFIIGGHTAVEVKAKRSVGDSDLRSLRALAEEGNMKRSICVARESRRRTVGKIMILPYAEFLGELWAGKYR